MQPKYKSRKTIDIGILVTKWKLFVPKRKTTSGQSNPRNLLSEEIASYKTVVLTNLIVVVVP
jgi:hypothetical protein